MQLKLKDRYMLLNLLPQAGDFSTMRTIAALRDSLLPSEEETQRMEIKAEGAAIRWKASEDTGADIAIGPVANSVIVQALTKLNEEKALTLDTLPIYEMFVEPAPAA